LDREFPVAKLLVRTSCHNPCEPANRENMLRIQLNRLCIIGDCAAVFFPLFTRKPAIVVGENQPRIDLNRPIEISKGFLKKTFLLIQNSPINVSARIVWIELYSLIA